MSFGKMATLLFGLAGLLALISLKIGAVASLAGDAGGAGGRSGGGGAVVLPSIIGGDPTPSDDHPAEEASTPQGGLRVDFGAVHGDPVREVPPLTDDEMPATGQDDAPQQLAAAPAQPSLPPPPPATPAQPGAASPPRIQAAPQVSFVPGQPMTDTNPSR